jgi:hypothetical protein
MAYLADSSVAGWHRNRSDRMQVCTGDSELTQPSCLFQTAAGPRRDSELRALLEKKL